MAPDRDEVVEPRVVVLDDDPTGTQAARGVTVLLDDDPHALAEALERESSVYLQTNSRALTEAEAVVRARRVKDSIDDMQRTAGHDVRVVLRGDSTLRGHVFAETRVFMSPGSVMLFVPAFPEGGRVTRGGMHYVRTDEQEVPVAETEYAADPVFSFDTSSLPDFVRARTGQEAISLGLDAVRAGGLGSALTTAPAGAILLADAESGDDIRLIAAGVREAWRTRSVIVRCAASLAAELAGVASSALLPASVLATDGGVVFVCGSHTDLARDQLAGLAQRVGPPTEIDTLRALADPVGEGRRAALAELAQDRPDGIRLVTTQRQRRAEHASLGHGARVMRALSTAASILAADAEVVVTKGGITAAEVIAGALHARRAIVLGQVQPGVSVWDAERSAGRPVRVLIVPGNMGSRDILADAASWVRSSPAI